MKGTSFALLLLACLVAGCRVTMVQRIWMDTRILNDDNTLLTVEGRTNLPETALIEARLSDGRGRKWATGKGEVSRGRFFLVLDISRCPGFRKLNLDVYFDPLVATAKVQRLTGPRGEALGGPLVHEVHDRMLVLRREKLMLQMSRREAALRKLESGDGDVQELESYISRHPNDAEALIGLGLAYLKQRPSERHPGSKAQTFLERGLQLKPRSGKLEMEARIWVSRLELEARRIAEERERARQPKGLDLLNTADEVVPGQSLGAFKLGMKLKYLMRHFPLDHMPSPTAEGVEIFHLEGAPDIELKVDRAQGVLVGASSSSDRYRTADGIRVGSLLEDVRALVPDVTVEYGPETAGSDGRMHSSGVLELEGLNLTIDRSVNPDFPLALETVSRIEVVP